MAMDEKKSSFFPVFHTTEIIFLLHRIFKTPALGGDLKYGQKTMQKFVWKNNVFTPLSAQMSYYPPDDGNSTSAEVTSINLL